MVVTQDLIKYISYELQRGTNETILINNLLKKDWSRNDILSAINYVKSKFNIVSSNFYPKNNSDFNNNYNQSYNTGSNFNSNNSINNSFDNVNNNSFSSLGNSNYSNFNRNNNTNDYNRGNNINNSSSSSLDFNLGKLFKNKVFLIGIVTLLLLIVVFGAFLIFNHSSNNTLNQNLAIANYSMNSSSSNLSDSAYGINNNGASLKEVNTSMKNSNINGNSTNFGSNNSSASNNLINNVSNNSLNVSFNLSVINFTKYFLNFSYNISYINMDSLNLCGYNQSGFYFNKLYLTNLLNRSSFMCKFKLLNSSWLFFKSFGDYKNHSEYLFEFLNQTSNSSFRLSYAVCFLNNTDNLYFVEYLNNIFERKYNYSLIKNIVLGLNTSSLKNITMSYLIFNKSSFNGYKPESLNDSLNNNYVYYIRNVSEYCKIFITNITVNISMYYNNSTNTSSNKNINITTNTSINSTMISNTSLNSTNFTNTSSVNISLNISPSVYLDVNVSIVNHSVNWNNSIYSLNGSFNGIVDTYIGFSKYCNVRNYDKITKFNSSKLSYPGFSYYGSYSLMNITSKLCYVVYGVFVYNCKNLSNYFNRSCDSINYNFSMLANSNIMPVQNYSNFYHLNSSEINSNMSTYYFAGYNVSNFSKNITILENCSSEMNNGFFFNLNFSDDLKNCEPFRCKYKNVYSSNYSVMGVLGRYNNTCVFVNLGVPDNISYEYNYGCKFNGGQLMNASYFSDIVYNATVNGENVTENSSGVIINGTFYKNPWNYFLNNTVCILFGMIYS